MIIVEYEKIILYISITFIMKFKLNYFRLLLFFTFLWVSINLWYIVYSVYNLNNGGIIDTTTSLQSLLSVFNRKVFVNTIPGGSYFSVHESFILYLLLPFISVYRSFITLYIIQSVIIYSASIPLFLIGRRHTGNDKISFIMALAYLFNPYIHDNPFETLTLFMGFIIYSFYFFDSKNYKAFFIVFIISLSTMEFNPLIGGFFGLYLILLYTFDLYRNNIKEFIKERKSKYIIEPLKYIVRQRYFYLAISILLISITFFEVDKYSILYFSHNTHPISSNIAGSNQSSIFSLLYGFKSGLSSKIKSIMELNMPFLFLSFLDPFALMELPWFMASGISSFGPYWSPYVYYDSYIIPFAAIAAVLGISRIYKLLDGLNKKNKIISMLSYLVLFVTIILLISTAIIPMFENPVKSVSNENAGVAQLASLIPKNQSVYTGVNELPIVSSYVPDTWFYGSPKNYTLFNVSNGPPYSLNGYHFVAGSGNYALYSKTYNGNVKFNNILTDYNTGKFNPGYSLRDSKNIFLPSGSYNLSLNYNYSPLKINETGFNKGNTSMEYLNDSYAMIYPLKYNINTTLNRIAINSKMRSGYYTIQSMISSSLNASSSLQSYSFNHNQYNYVSEVLHYNLTLKAGKTYYLWLWSSGDPGGMYYPVHNGSKNTYIAKIYNGTGTTSYGYYFKNVSSINSSNLNPQIFVYGFNKNGKKLDSNLTLQVINGNEAINKTVTIKGNGKYTFNFNLSKSGETSISLSSNIVNGYFNSNNVLSSVAYKNNDNNFYLENPYIVLSLIFIIALPLLMFSLIAVNIPKLYSIESISRLILIASLISYYLTLTLYFYHYVDISLLAFKYLGLIISISLLLYLLNYKNWK